MREIKGDSQSGNKYRIAGAGTGLLPPANCLDKALPWLLWSETIGPSGNLS
jgi:hypothetical protein